MAHFRIVRVFWLCFSDTNDDDEYGLSNDKVKPKLSQNCWCQMKHLAWLIDSFVIARKASKETKQSAQRSFYSLTQDWMLLYFPK